MDKATFNLEERLATGGYQIIIGVDEAGRGPLAGPVVAAAVVYKSANFAIPADQAKIFELVRDSKKLSHSQREKAFDFIQENFEVGVGICDHQTIDRINILEASFLAMKKAIADLIRNKSKNQNKKLEVEERLIILVDGNKVIPNFSHEQRAIVGGDRIVKSISAASIVAKVARDRLMLEMHAKYPDYGFDQHKGYGTGLHVERLNQHGPCDIHRRSFEPVKTLRKQKNGAMVKTL